MPRPAPSRDSLILAAIDLFRRNGYTATTVETICTTAGVTKGAFFHHFDSKETLAEACLGAWCIQTTAMDEAAPYRSVSDPVARVLACMDFYADLFADPTLVRSCLAGTTVQEVSETNDRLRCAAHACLAGAEARFAALLVDAAAASDRVSDRSFDPPSLAALWVSVIQGALILSKASGDSAGVPATLMHVRRYIESLLTGRAPG